MQYFGKNGIIEKNKQAKKLYESSIQREERKLNQLLAEYENAMKDPPKPITGPNGKPLVNKDTVTTTNHGKIIGEDKKGNQIVVPKGFKVAEESGTTVQDGIVIEDDEQNQFVWIPVSNINHDGSNKIIKNDGSKVEITLGRYTFNATTGEEIKVQYGSEYAATTVAAVTAGTVSQYKAKYDKDNENNGHYELADSRISNNSGGADGTNTTAKNLKAFIESVQDNYGYYLARYEASHSTTDATKPASKKATVWKNISQPNASVACRSIYNGNTKVGVESDLCNSYAWNTAIVYIQAMGNNNYANANRDTTGNTSELKTGETGDEKCKIFDMAANYYEWTTEYSILMIETNAFVCSGAGGCWRSSTWNAGGRYCNTAIKCDQDCYSFRILLYL